MPAIRTALLATLLAVGAATAAPAPASANPGCVDISDSWETNHCADKGCLDWEQQVGSEVYYTRVC